MDLIELFNDLESTNTTQVEQSKKILGENFSNGKHYISHSYYINNIPKTLKMVLRVLYYTYIQLTISILNILVKESWLVYGMMEYFNQTNSSRAVDVLVKVLAPHDTHIFDKLLDWVNGPNKNQAITLFGCIVEKHPSWLHKVANHQLLKDVLKLLKVCLLLLLFVYVVSFYSVKL